MQDGGLEMVQDQQCGMGEGVGLMVGLRQHGAGEGEGKTVGSRWHGINSTWQGRLNVEVTPLMCVSVGTGG